MQGLIANLSFEVVHFALQPVDLILKEFLLILDLLHVVFQLFLLVILGVGQTLNLDNVTSSFNILDHPNHAKYFLRFKKV